MCVVSNVRKRPEPACLLLIALILLSLVVILPCIKAVRSAAEEVVDGVGVEVVGNDDADLKKDGRMSDCSR